MKKLLLFFAVLLTAFAGNSASKTISFDIDSKTLGQTGTGYIQTEFAFSVGDNTFKANNVVPSSGQVRGNNSSVAKDFCLFNITPIEDIESIEIAYSGTIATDKIYFVVGDNAITSAPTAGGNGTAENGILKFNITEQSKSYFRIQFINKSTSGTVTVSKVTINYGKDPRTSVDLSFPEKEYSVNLGDTFGAPELTVNPEKEEIVESITYESSNPDVATVDEKNGDVKIKAAGIATITASFAGNTTYTEAEVSYKLNVFDPNATEVVIIAEGADYTGNISTRYTSNDPKAMSAPGVCELISSNGAYNASDKGFRLYSGSTLTIKPVKDIIIKKVEFIETNGSTVSLKSGSEGSVSKNNQTVTWTGSSSKDIVLSFSPQARTKYFEIYYEIAEPLAAPVAKATINAVALSTDIEDAVITYAVTTDGVNAPELNGYVYSDPLYFDEIATTDGTYYVWAQTKKSGNESEVTMVYSFDFKKENGIKYSKVAGEIDANHWCIVVAEYNGKYFAMGPNGAAAITVANDAFMGYEHQFNGNIHEYQHNDGVLTIKSAVSRAAGEQLTVVDGKVMMDGKELGFNGTDFAPGATEGNVMLYTTEADKNTGIDEVEANDNAPVEYFNLQGVRVENPANGLYIKRQGSKVTKVIIR